MLAELARQIGGGFYALFARISKFTCSGLPHNAPSPCKCPIHGLWLFIRFLLSLLCLTTIWEVLIPLLQVTNSSLSMHEELLSRIRKLLWCELRRLSWELRWVFPLLFLSIHCKLPVWSASDSIEYQLSHYHICYKDSAGSKLSETMLQHYYYSCLLY